MTNRKFRVILVSLLAVLSSSPAVLADGPARVLIIHSYEQGHVCGQPQHDGVIEALANAGREDVEVSAFYMDTKRTYTKPDEIAERGRLALEHVKQVKPDVVVTLDDNAARTVMLPLAGSDTPVVFCGLNGQPEHYNRSKQFMKDRAQPGSNVTGVYEKLHVATSIKVLDGVLPDLKKVLAITDGSPTGNAITTQLELELSDTPPPVPCEIVKVKDFAEFQDLILNRVNTDPEIGAIYSVVLRVETPDGETYNAGDVFRWQIANCTKPSMALNYFFAKLGLFGGAAVDFKAMGRQAGDKVNSILAGVPPGDLPIEDARRYAIVFNTARAMDLGIAIPFDILAAADVVYDSIVLK